MCRKNMALFRSIIVCSFFGLVFCLPAHGQQDWFLTENVYFTAPYGGQVLHDTKIGLHYISMPPVVNPGQNVRLMIRWFTEDVEGSPVVYMNGFGDWIPYQELFQCSLYGGIAYDYMNVEDTLFFTAPSIEGSYRLRWCWASAYAPLTEFWGHEPGGVEDPGVGPFSEISFRVEDHQATGVGGGGPDAIPSSSSVSQNYPNPFNPKTRINFSVPTGGRITVKIYNTLGQLVKTLVEEYKAPGEYSVEWDGTNDDSKQLASGTYLYQIATADYTSAKKMLLLR